jgi:DNA polymerase III epsilon subunit-like protein
MELSFLKGTEFVFLDLETTSASVAKTHIREFGMAEFVDGVKTREGSALFSGGKSEPMALKVHGIAEESVMGKPTFASKAKDVGNILSNKIIGGHNVMKFDLPIIARILAEKGHRISGSGEKGRIRIVDTLLLARKHLHAPSNKLEDLCPMYDIVHGGHRAHGDAISSWNLFLKIIEITGNTNINDYIKVI